MTGGFNNYQAEYKTGKLCKVFFTMKLLFCGSICTFYQVIVFIAIKIAREGKEDDHTKEQNIPSPLELSPPGPYLVQGFFWVPKITFLELFQNDDLVSLLCPWQTIDSGS